MLLILETYHNLTFHCHPQVISVDRLSIMEREISFRNKRFSWNLFYCPTAKVKGTLQDILNSRLLCPLCRFSIMEIIR
jgi:hypothetical protein